jgi:hypothetical protein
MSSDRRIQSSRANGAKSRGPVTPEGRARSSQNAIRHGFNAQTLVLGNESADEFEELLLIYIEYWQPADPIEMDLVEEMVAAKWRQRRMWGVETAAYDLRMEQQEAKVAVDCINIHAAGRQCIAIDSLINEANTVALYLRYESRMNRTYDRAFTRLEKLKNSQNEPNPDSEQNEPFGPNSEAQIEQSQPDPIVQGSNPSCSPEPSEPPALSSRSPILEPIATPARQSLRPQLALGANHHRMPQKTARPPYQPQRLTFFHRARRLAHHILGFRPRGIRNVLAIEA